MLLESFRLEFFNNECMPSALSLQCFAHLDQDVGAALPYLNAVLCGYEYIKDPPAVTFRSHGKLISEYARKIALNAIKDEAEAHKIIRWLQREINAAWENRSQITPCYKGTPKPSMVQILQLLPNTNCGDCGAPTCMVYATRLIEGAAGTADCPSLSDACRQDLKQYMKLFEGGLVTSLG